MKCFVCRCLASRAVKKRFSAIVMLLFSIAVLSTFDSYRDQHVDQYNILAFDPTIYRYSYVPVDFMIPTVHNRWVPTSLVEFDATGAVIQSDQYTIDSSGTLVITSMDESTHDYVPGYPCNVDFWAHAFDANTEVTLYFEKGYPENNDSFCCAFAVTKEEKTAYDEYIIGNRYYYQIASFGQYGYSSEIRSDWPRYIETDADGILKLLVVSGAVYIAYWFDDFGRTSWIGVYDRNGTLCSYTVLEYKELDA